MKNTIKNEQFTMNKKNLPSMIFGTILAIGIVISAFSTSVYALSINIDPSNVKLILKSGDSKEGSIQVTNNGSLPVKISAYTEDWVYASDGSKTFMKPGSSVYSCSSWIKLDPSNFDMSPKETKNIGYKITAPKNISGGHVSVIFFEAQISSVEGIAVSGRIGTIVYQDTEGDIRREVEFKDLLVTPSSEGTPIDIKISLVNKGNSHTGLKAKLNIRKDDKTVIEKELLPINLLPQDITTSRILLQNDLKEGNYKLKIELSYDDKKLEKDTDFSIKKI